MDAPEGHLARGDQEIAFAAEDLQGIEGVATSNRSGRQRRGRRRRRGDAYSLQLSGAADRQRTRTQEQMIDGDAAAAASIPATGRASRSRNALGSGEGQGGFAISANILGPDLKQLADYSMQALAAAQRLPSLAEAED